MELAGHERLRVLCGGLAALWLATRGYRRGSLSLGGSVAAFTVGFVSLASSWRFGATLLLFYYSSTRLTRFRAALKRKIEDGHQEGGNRSAIQVLASSLPGVLLALWSFLRFRHDAPLAATRPPQSLAHLGFLLFFAACTGDTWASEVGLVLPTQSASPVLILDWRRTVPRGTNGGVSLEGTLASGAGGLFIGTAYFLFGPSWDPGQAPLLLVGLLGGLLGSALDSALGSIFQASWYDPVAKKVLSKTPAHGTDASRRSILICGHDLLGGEAINLLSAVLTMSLAFPLLHIFPGN